MAVDVQAQVYDTTAHSLHPLGPSYMHVHKSAAQESTEHSASY